jgi:hypothetical protein
MPIEVLEEMSKMSGAKKSRSFSNSIKMNKTAYPHLFDKDRTYGVKIGYQDETMSQVIEQDFARKHLEKQIDKYEAIEAMKINTLIKDIPNRANELRK